MLALIFSLEAIPFQTIPFIEYLVAPSGDSVNFQLTHGLLLLLHLLLPLEGSGEVGQLRAHGTGRYCCISSLCAGGASAEAAAVEVAGAVVGGGTAEAAREKCSKFKKA